MPSEPIPPPPPGPDEAGEQPTEPRSVSGEPGSSAGAPQTGPTPPGPPPPDVVSPGSPPSGAVPPGGLPPGAPNGPPPGPGAGDAPPEHADPFAIPQRLHPASIVFGIPLTQLIQAMIVPAIASFSAGGIYTVFFFAIAGVIGLGVRTASWSRRVFSFDGEVLRVDSGVISRSHRSLDVARIQQVEIQRGAIPRLFGLASIRVETAGSASEPEVDLRVLPDADAVALRAAVRASKARADGHEQQPIREDGEVAEPEARRILTVPLKHVIINSVTGARLLVLPAIIGGALQFIGQQMGQFIDTTIGFVNRQGTDLVEGRDWPLIIGSGIAVLILAVVVAIVVGIFRDGNFRIERVDDDLYVTRGIVSTHESVVPLRRVQLVEVKRNWLRRLLGYAVIRIRSAGGSSGGDGVVTVPLLADDAIDGLLDEVLPKLEGVPALTSHPPQALRRGLFRWLRANVLIVALAWLVPMMIPDSVENPALDLIPYVSLALLPLAVVLAIVEYRHLGHGLTPLVVAARRGALSITTTLAPVVKVQAVTTRRNWFQRRLGLSVMTAHVAGPSATVEVLDAARSDAARLHERLTEHAASPIPMTAADTDPGAEADTDTAASTEAGTRIDTPGD